MIDTSSLSNEKINDTTFYKAAAAYVTKLGWAVIPINSIKDGRCTCGKANCSSPGKHPLVRYGSKEATKDLKVIESWSRKFPDSNVGIVTGAESGLFVLDVDGDIGKESLEQLEEEYGSLPHTVEAVTGSGGQHFLFQYEPLIKNKVGFFPGLDIRSDQGFIVAAPSLHISGNQYEWELSSRPMETAVAKAPDWLIGLLKPRERSEVKRKPTSYWLPILEGLKEGEGRNQAAASLSGMLLRKFETAIAYEFLLMWNERNKPSLDSTELDITFNSILKKELERIKQQGGG